MKALFFLLIPLFLLSSNIAFGAGPEFRPEGTFVVHQIVPHPVKPEEAFAITSNFGILKSDDAGVNWKRINNGIKSFTHHALAISGSPGYRLYAGAWGGGVSRSDDDGQSWIEINNGLANTAVDAIAIDSDDSDRLYIATTTHLYRQVQGEWTVFDEGILPFPDEIRFKSLLLFPGRPKLLWLGTAKGLFFRPVDSPRWSEIAEFHGSRISALECDSRRKTLWVGTVGKGLYLLTPGGRSRRISSFPDRLWISEIAIDPSGEETVYVATRGKGIFRSADGGGTWTSSNSGLDDPDIRSLAIQPKNRLLLYAGTTARGIFRSVDGGMSWSPAHPLPPLTMPEIVEQLDASNGPSLPVPEVISKCNRCHGWTDPFLNRKITYWRVPPNPRKWDETVRRMSERAGLSPQEERELIDFLSKYSAGTAR